MHFVSKYKLEIQFFGMQIYNDHTLYFYSITTILNKILFAKFYKDIHLKAVKTINFIQYL